MEHPVDSMVDMMEHLVDSMADMMGHLVVLEDEKALVA